MGLKVEKTRLHLLKHRKTFVLRRKLGKRNLLISVINTITLSNGVFQFLGQTRKFKKNKSKKVLRIIVGRFAEL